MRNLHTGCYCYHKGTYFQANHNSTSGQPLGSRVVIATTKVRIFKQITTYISFVRMFSCCYCYHKGTYFQANHNNATKQYLIDELLLLPQRYVFSSKSQHEFTLQLSRSSCYCYHKGTYFQANHNYAVNPATSERVVIATTKVRIFKQITT